MNEPAKPWMTGQALAEGLTSPYPEIRQDAVRNAEVLNSMQIERALHDADFKVQAEVWRRHDMSFTADQIKEALESPVPLIRRLVVSRSDIALTRTQFDAALDPQYSRVVAVALATHFEFELSPEQLEAALNHPEDDVRLAAVRRPEAEELTSVQFRRMVQDESLEIAINAMRNRTAFSDEDLKAAEESRHSLVREAGALRRQVQDASAPIRKLGNAAFNATHDSPSAGASPAHGPALNA